MIQERAAAAMGLGAVARGVEEVEMAVGAKEVGV